MPRSVHRIIAFAAVLGAAVAPAAAEELMTGIVGTAPHAQQSERRITLAGDWQVDCDRSGDTETCRMSTAGTAEAGDGRTVAIQLASESADAADRLFFFLTPLDLLLAKGAEMRIDGGRASNLAYRSCHAQGCVIPFRLSATLDASFRRGTKIGLRLFDIDGSAIDVELSLLGFVAASEVVAQR